MCLSICGGLYCGNQETRNALPIHLEKGTSYMFLDLDVTGDKQDEKNFGTAPLVAKSPHEISVIGPLPYDQTAIRTDH